MIITITNKEHKEYIKGKYVSAHNFVTCIENNILFVEFTYFSDNMSKKCRYYPTVEFTYFSDNMSKKCRYYPATKLFILVKNKY